jgi:hypothetical protein
MTDKERTKLNEIEGGLEMLRNAIAKGDPHRELEFRARDLLADVRFLSKRT